MPKNPIDYANGLQYKIVCKDPAITDCYNGSCVSFKDRKKNHKSKSNNPNDPDHNYKVYRFIREHGGWDNWEMIQLELSPCKNNQELRLREREIFDVLKPTLNMISPMTTPEELKKWRCEYNIKHSDKQKTYMIEYHASHKKEAQEYKIKNRDKILAKQRECDANRRDERLKNVSCECGCEVTKSSLSKHQKTKKHLKLMQLK